MKKYFKNLYRKVALHIYNVGAIEHEKYWHHLMKKKVTTGENTRFTKESSIINLADDCSRISIGTNCNISGLMMVYNYGGAITMGNDCSLSPLSRIVSTENITIGNRVLIAHNVNIIDNNSHPLDAGLRHQDYMESFTTGMKKHDLNAKRIIIEDDVWIGHDTTILKGVKIGKGAIIGACSLVTKDVEAWTVNVGNPLRRI